MRLATFIAAVGLALIGIHVQAQTSDLVIGTGSVLPWATVDAAYSLTMTASGGTSPYTWAVVSGVLPPGLNLDASGLLYGTPLQTGNFIFTVAVTDSSGMTASRTFSLLVILPPTPTLSITGLPDTVSPAEQPEFDIQLSAPYSRDITGAITLTFEPNAENPADDPAIQFATGGRVLNFLVPAGQTSPRWDTAHAIQTGTVAGRIKLRLNFSARGQDLTPLFPPSRTVTIPQSAPKIDSVAAVRTSGGLDVSITGYSTPRAVTQAVFNFTAAQAGGSQTISVTVPLESVFAAWYTDEAATQFGSAFRYTQSFTVKGNTADVTAVSVTLSNSMGASSSVSANF